MNPRPVIWLLLVLALVPAGTVSAFFDEWELDTQQISEAGQEIFERVTPESIHSEYEFISAEELDVMFSEMQQALNGESFSELAAAGPQARETLNRLRADPNRQGYADWLQARMDYFDMAAETQRARRPLPPHPKTPTRRLPPHPNTPRPKLIPHPKTPQPELIPHPATPQPKLIPHPEEPEPATAPAPVPAPQGPADGSRYAENKQAWLKKLAGRRPPARAAALLPGLKEIFRAEGIPAQFVWQAEAESTFNPAARSPAGAVGLYQFMPATARQFGLKLSPRDERLDAQKNARAAARYLKLLHRRFGSWPLAFAAYNCGQGRVSKTLRATGGTTFDDIQHKLPAETRMYVPKIAALIQLRENADLDLL